MFCKNCGAKLRENAKFCPECGVTAENTLPPPINEYSYETLTNLFPWKGVIQIILVAWLPFAAIGLMVTIIEGFLIVSVIMNVMVLLAIFLIAWAYKGKQKKWGKDRTLWIITPEGFAGGYPPDVAKRLALLGVASAAATFGRENWGVTSHGINMAKNITTVINGLPVNPWENYIKAEYRPAKLEIALHKMEGRVALISTNPDNYAYVEQLVRGYMGNLIIKNER